MAEHLLDVVTEGDEEPQVLPTSTPLLAPRPRNGRVRFLADADAMLDGLVVDAETPGLHDQVAPVHAQTHVG